MKLKTESERGSILIVSLLTAGTVGFVAGTFLRSILNESKLARLDFYNASAIQLADAGGETGILALNEDDWTGWSVTKDEAVRTLPSIDVGDGKSGQVTIKVSGIDTTPSIVSEAKIEIDERITVRRQIEYELRPRSLFGNAVTAGDYIYFYRGDRAPNTVRIDSYDSKSGPYHPFFNRRDGGTIASDSTYSYRTSSGEVFGYASTNSGRGRKNPPSLGTYGKIYGPQTESWVMIDPDRLSRDFRASFTDISAPSVKTSIRLPSKPVIELGSGSVRETYRISGDLRVSIDQTLRIVGNVVLVVGDDFFLDGRLEILEPFGELTLYIADDVIVRNDGIFNFSEDPSKLIIYSTATRPNQSRFFFMGEADLHAAIYAPKSYVDFIGDGVDGKLFGAVVGDRVVFRGNFDLHFDEQLKRFSGENPSFTVDRWAQLDASELLDLDPM